MTKNILLAKSSPNKRSGLDILFAELALSGYNFRKIGRWKSSGPENGQWPSCSSGRWLSFGPKTSGAFSSWIFLSLLPFFSLLAYVYFGFFCSQKKADALVCYGLNEKIILTLVARIFKVSVIWLEFPETDYRQTNRLLRALYKRFSKHAKLIAFSNDKKEKLLAMGVPAENISVILPGIRLNYRQHQDSLFNNLAKVEQGNFRKNYFTVGLIVDLDERQNLESIFQSVCKALDMIPNIQIMIVGDGKERKNLSWLAKRMKIDNLVWFVGEQKHLRKWLDSFDIYLIGAVNPKLDDYNAALEAMQAGLPIIGPAYSGLEDVVRENKNGVLIEMHNSEMLALQIIKLQQEKELRKSLGQAGQAMVEGVFSLDVMVYKFKEIL